MAEEKRLDTAFRYLMLQQRGITHIFFSEFEDVADRDYYLDVDPAHQAFKASLGPVVDIVQVLDFIPGVF